MRARLGDDRGQAVPVVVAFAMVTMVMILVLGAIGTRLHDAARARTAADAAALAGAAEGRDAAVAMAVANGGRLEWFSTNGRVVEVVVRVGSVSARARAEATVSWESGAMAMDFDSVVDGDLFTGDRFRWRMGVRALAPGAWLQIDDDFEADLAEKARLLDHGPGRSVAWLEGSERAGEEVQRLVAEALAVHGRRAVVEGDHPIDRSGRSVQEDVCLMERVGGAWVLTAGSVCFPTRWDIGDKIGKSLVEIHAPVPGYARRLGVAVDRFFDRMALGASSWRLNWSIVDDPGRRLDVADRQAPVRAPSDLGHELHLRLERQTLRRLTEHAAVVFTIRVHSWPLQTVADRLPAAVCAAHLASMPVEIARYKNLEGIREPLIEWLRRR